MHHVINRNLIRAQREQPLAGNVRPGVNGCQLREMRPTGTRDHLKRKTCPAQVKVNQYWRHRINRWVPLMDLPTRINRKPNITALNLPAEARAKRAEVPPALSDILRRRPTQRMETNWYHQNNQVFGGRWSFSTIAPEWQSERLHEEVSAKRRFCVLPSSERTCAGSRCCPVPHLSFKACLIGSGFGKIWWI
jgi:hypothetical protein